jgi:hypothetical protein
MAFGRNAEAYGENEPADCVYKVISGAVRNYKVLNDGRGQIDAFNLPGDIFGLELGDEHSCSAEAITETPSCWSSARTSSPQPCGMTGAGSYGWQPPRTRPLNGSPALLSRPVAGSRLQDILSVIEIAFTAT